MSKGIEARIELAAKTSHEVNRAYCAGLGDLSQVSWEDSPEWQRASAREGVMRICANPSMHPRDSHDSWMDVKRAEGWTYGEVKDVEKKTHPCFLPYDELPPAQQTKDYLFGAVVRGVLMEADDAA